MSQWLTRHRNGWSPLLTDHTLPTSQLYIYKLWAVKNERFSFVRVSFFAVAVDQVRCDRSVCGAKMATRRGWSYHKVTLTLSSILTWSYIMICIVPYCLDRLKLSVDQHHLQSQCDTHKLTWLVEMNVSFCLSVSLKVPQSLLPAVESRYKLFLMLLL